MTDTSNVDPDSPAQAYPATIVQAPLTVGDPDRAAKFLAEHRGRAQGAEDDFSRIMQQRQDAVAKTQGMLDKTIQELRDRHEGKGLGQVNLPLLALGAGLLSAPRPGTTSNFGTELGAGLKGLGSAVQQQRMGDTEFLKGVADLQAKSGQLSDVPLRDAASLAKARQLKEEGDIGGIEKALITSKADRPQSLGGGIMFDPRTNKVINAYTQQEINLDPSKVGTDPTGKSLVGSDTHGEDFLKSIADPSLREAIKGFGDYDTALPSMGRSPQAMSYMNYIFSLAKQYNPDFDAKQYPTIQKGMKDWTGAGALNQRTISAATATGHLANLHEAGAALDNGDFQKYNTFSNWLKSNTGDPRAIAFKAALLPVVTEMTKFLGGGHAAEGTMNSWLDTINAANSPKQLQGSLNEFVKIMHTQLQELAASKTRDLGGKRTYSPDDLIGSGADVVKSVLSNDISTPGGRMAVLRRGENTTRKLQGLPELPQADAPRWEALATKLKQNPKLAPDIDADFGPGTSARLMGKAK